MRLTNVVIEGTDDPERCRTAVGSATEIHPPRVNPREVDEPKHSVLSIITGSTI
jgi:hypothetical protein